MYRQAKSDLIFKNIFFLYILGSFPLLHPVFWLECDLPLVTLGVLSTSPFRVVLKGHHPRLWLDKIDERKKAGLYLVVGH